MGTSIQLEVGDVSIAYAKNHMGMDFGYAERETAALNMIYSAFYHYSGWFTKGAPVGMHVASASAQDEPATYFGTDAHFKTLKLRDVNVELDLLTGTDIRQ